MVMLKALAGTADTLAVNTTDDGLGAGVVCAAVQDTNTTAATRDSRPRTCYTQQQWSFPHKIALGLIAPREVRHLLHKIWKPS